MYSKKILLVSGLILLIFTSCTTKKKYQKPNIILILADDLGYADLGFQGSKRVVTPHLDRLAKGGVRFTDGHVSASVCSPSRAGLITGRYQQRFGHEANVPPRPHGMDTKERTLAQALKEQGYTTACFGKWHLGNEEIHYPTVRGFDRFYGLRGGSRSYWYNEERHDGPGDTQGIELNGTQVKFEGHLTDRLGDEAVKFIEENKDQPFFTYLSFTAPHAPLESKPEDLEALNTDDNYLGLIYGMDRNIGKVLNALDDNNLMENTMIWFLSDNGGIGPTYSNHPLGGFKGFKFEGGHRVPFLLYWEGHVPAGQDYENMVSALDIYPTSLAAAGGSLEQARPLDGVDLIPFIKGKNSGIPHERMYWRKLDCAAMRDGIWKLIRVGDNVYGLYNLENDIGERKELSAQMPEKTEQLRKMLEEWEKDKIEPSWLLGEIGMHMRYNYHTERFKNPDYTVEEMIDYMNKVKVRENLKQTEK